MRTILRGMHCRAWYVMQDSKYDRILNAAASLIRRGGSDALTTTALARESRTSTRDIYHHFEDKYAVISALVERLHALYYSTINEAIKEATSPEDELAKIVDASFSDRLFNEDNMHIWVEYWRFVRFDSVKFNFANNAYDQSMARMLLFCFGQS